MELNIFFWIIHSKTNNKIPSYIMKKNNIPSNTSAIIIGMGLGQIKDQEIDKYLNNNIPKLIDADIFHNKMIQDIINFNKGFNQ